MQAALLVTWTHPMLGREEKALAYGIEVQEFWGKKAAEGKCTEPELMFADSGKGYWFVRGERKTLLEIQDSDEARMLLMKGELLLESFSAEICHAGDDATDYMLRYGQALTAIS